MYEQGSSGAFFSDQAAENFNRRSAVLPGFGTLAQGPWDVFQSLNNPEALSQKSFGNFLQFVHSAFTGEDELQAEHSRSLWGRIINVGDEQRERIDRDEGRTLYAATQEIMMVYLESDGGRVWEARTRAAMDFQLGSLAAVLHLDDSLVSPCSLPRASESLLLTRQSAAAQMGHDEFVVTDGE